MDPIDDNGWTDENTGILETMYDKVDTLHTIHTQVYKNYKSELDDTFNFNIYSFRMVVIMTLVSLACYKYNHDIIMYGCHVAILYISILAATHSYEMKINDINDLFSKLCWYNCKLNTFKTEVDLQILLPKELRINAAKFIKFEYTNYQYIQASRPDIYEVDVKYAEKILRTKAKKRKAQATKTQHSQDYSDYSNDSDK